jgi:3-hydroxyisobutyrate dehydrogenase
MDKPTVGFIGLGVMGGAMSRNILKADFPLFVYDIRKEAIKDLVALGAKATTSPKEVAERSAIIMTSLPAPSNVKDVCFGEKGILEGAKRGSTFIEFSTIDPETMRDIAKVAKQKGVGVLDAPVGGTRNEAEAGSLLFWVSGDSNSLKQCEGVLSLLGRTMYCGEDPGIGKTVKLINNLMAIGNLVTAIEAFTLGVKMGLKPRFLFEVLSKAGGSSSSFLNRFPKVMDGDFSQVSFSAALATKDSKLALGMANDNQVPMPVASAVFQMCLKTLASGYGNDDITSVARLYEAWAGVSSKSGPEDK